MMEDNYNSINMVGNKPHPAETEATRPPAQKHPAPVTNNPGPPKGETRGQDFRQEPQQTAGEWKYAADAGPGIWAMSQQ